jgi:hypothetical protein
MPALKAQSPAFKDLSQTPVPQKKKQKQRWKEGREREKEANL